MNFYLLRKFIIYSFSNSFTIIVRGLLNIKLFGFDPYTLYFTSTSLGFLYHSIFCNFYRGLMAMLSGIGLFRMFTVGWTMWDISASLEVRVIFSSPNIYLTCNESIEVPRMDCLIPVRWLTVVVLVLFEFTFESDGNIFIRANKIKSKTINSLVNTCIY